MEKNFLASILPEWVGISCMIIGWYISILNVGLARFQKDILFTKWTLIGLALIIIGAYLPRIWYKLRGE